MLIAQLCYMMSYFIRFKAVITAIGSLAFYRRDFRKVSRGSGRTGFSRVGMVGSTGDWIS
jgi:hypothetical protein